MQKILQQENISLAPNKNSLKEELKRGKGSEKGEQSKANEMREGEEVFDKSEVQQMYLKLFNSKNIIKNVHICN